jgi:hypothetical protein
MEFVDHCGGQRGSSFSEGTPRAGESFAVETTLSGKSYLHMMQYAKGIDRGFEVVLIYIGTESVEINLARIAKRVLGGGHNVPEMAWHGLSRGAGLIPGPVRRSRRDDQELETRPLQTPFVVFKTESPVYFPPIRLGNIKMATSEEPRSKRRLSGHVLDSMTAALGEISQKAYEAAQSEGRELSFLPRSAAEYFDDRLRNLDRTLAMIITQQYCLDWPRMVGDLREYRLCYQPDDKTADSLLKSVLGSETTIRGVAHAKSDWRKHVRAQLKHVEAWYGGYPLWFIQAAEGNYSLDWDRIVGALRQGQFSYKPDAQACDNHLRELAIFAALDVRTDLLRSAVCRALIEDGFRLDRKNRKLIDTREDEFKPPIFPESISPLRPPSDKAVAALADALSAKAVNSALDPLLDLHGFPEWFMRTVEDEFGKNWQAVLGRLRDGQFFYRDRWSNGEEDLRHWDNILGRYLPEAEAAKIGEVLIQRLAALICSFFEQVSQVVLLSKVLRVDGFEVDKEKACLVDRNSLYPIPECSISYVEERERLKALINHVGLPGQVVPTIQTHIDHAVQNYTDGKFHEVLGESRCFIQALIDTITTETVKFGGHRKRDPGLGGKSTKTGPRIEYLADVSFLSSNPQDRMDEELGAVRTVWAYLCAGGHPGLTPREDARIGLILALEFGQLLALKFKDWKTSGYRGFSPP